MKSAAFGLCVMLTCTPAFAQMTIKQCTAASEPGKKVLVDDIVAGDPALAGLADTLASQIEQNLEQFRTESGLGVKVRPCQGRRPPGPSYFLPAIVEPLLDRDVVLEVWGRAVTLSDATGPYSQAEVGYVIVPVRYSEFTSSGPPGAFVVSNRIQTIQSVDDLVRVLNQSGRLIAYATLASGSILLLQAQWDPARTELCRAAAMLHALTPPATQDMELAAYAETLASEAWTGARGDTNYKGTMGPVGGAKCVM